MTTIGPGSGAEFFEELESWELFPKSDHPSVFDVDSESVLEFANSLWMSSPFVWREGVKPFSFVASSALHGSFGPYYELEPRVSRLRALVAFAGLYADQVIIPDPLSVAFRYPEVLSARIELVANLTMLRGLRPLIEAGIVVFGPQDVPVCSEGKKQLQAKQAESYDLIHEAVQGVWHEVEAEMDPRFEAVGRETLGGFAAEWTERVGPGLPDALFSLREGGIIGEPDRWELLKELAFDQVMNDLHYHAMLNWLYGVRYLTSRPVDHRVLSALARDSPVSPAASQGIVHELPFLEGLDAETLVRLRAEEGEAFQLYRSRVQQAMGETQGQPGKRVAEAFSDLVRPELARLDHAVASARKLARKNVRESLVFGAGVATIGIGTGLISPDAATVAAAFGGVKFGTDALKGLNELLVEPPVARHSDFYFLWRLKHSRI